MAITDVQVQVNDVNTRNVTLSYEPGVASPGLAEVHVGSVQGSYGTPIGSDPVVNTSRYASTFVAPAQTFFYRILVDRDVLEGSFQIPAPDPAGPVDELAAFALTPQLKLGQETDIVASAASAGVPTPNRAVEFSLDHGESNTHGTFTPALAQSDARGEARSKFKPRRPGTIKLKVTCEGQEARLSVKVKP